MIEDAMPQMLKLHFRRPPVVRCDFTPQAAADHAEMLRRIAAVNNWGELPKSYRASLRKYAEQLDHVARSG